MNTTEEKPFKHKGAANGGHKSKLLEYKQWIVGDRSFWFLFGFELVQLLFADIPGALGIQLRSFVYPFFFRKAGRGVVFGKGVSFRHPHKIQLGDGCILDDYTLLDAKGNQNEGIRLSDGVFIGRNSILSCKEGSIFIAKDSNIGFNCEVFSSNHVKIGESCVIAAYTYIVGGGTYEIHASAIPIAQFPNYEGKGGIRVGDGVWLGAHAVILDGVEIGDHGVIAAGSVVTKSTDEMSIYAGVPAKLVSKRA